MRRLSALILACILLLAACGAPAEESTSASSGGAIWNCSRGRMAERPAA